MLFEETDTKPEDYDYACFHQPNAKPLNIHSKNKIENCIKNGIKSIIMVIDSQNQLSI